MVFDESTAREKNAAWLSIKQPNLKRRFALDDKTRFHLFPPNISVDLCTCSFPFDSIVFRNLFIDKIILFNVRTMRKLEHFIGRIMRQKLVQKSKFQVIAHINIYIQGCGGFSREKQFSFVFNSVEKWMQIISVHFHQNWFHTLQKIWMFAGNFEALAMFTLPTWMMNDYNLVKAICPHEISSRRVRHLL